MFLNKVEKSVEQRNLTHVTYIVSRQVAFVLTAFVSINWIIAGGWVKAILNSIFFVMFFCASKLFEKKINRISISYIFFYLIVFLVYSICSCYYTKDRIIEFDQTGFQEWAIRDYYYTYFIGIFFVYVLIIFYLLALPKCKEIQSQELMISQNDSQSMFLGGCILVLTYFMTSEADVIIPMLSMLLCYVILVKKYRLISIGLLCISVFIFDEILLSRFKFVQVVFPIIILFFMFSKYNQKIIRISKIYGLLLVGLFIVAIYGTASEIFKLNTSYGMNYNIAEVFTSWDSMLYFFEKQLYRITAIWIKLGGYIIYHVERMGNYYWGLTFIKSLSGVFGFDYVSLPIISAGYNYSTYAQPGLFAEGYANFGILGAVLNIFSVFLFMEFTRKQFYKRQTISNFLFMTVPFTKILLDGGSLNSAILVFLVLMIGTAFGNLRKRKTIRIS